MNSLGKLLGLLTAAVVSAAFALPASAAKTITLAVTPVPAPLSSQTTVVSATISNTGNSNANSFEIDWSASPYFAVTSASAGGTSGTCGATNCVFLKQLPTKTSVTITLNVQVTNQCNSMSISWYAYAWTGSPGPVSQSFALQGTPPVTSSTPNCTIKFITQPADAFVGSTITGSRLNSAGPPVVVQLQRYGAAAVGTTVALSASSPCATTNTPSATTDSSGNVALDFTGAAAGSCKLNASATGFGAVDSQSFNVLQSDGILNCGDSTITASSGANSAIVQGTRLGNTDESQCHPIPYSLSSQQCTTAGDGTNTACKTTFQYDPLDQDPATLAFFFSWSWPLEALTPIASVPPTKVTFSSGNTTTLDTCVGSTATYSGSQFVSLTPPVGGFVDQDASNNPNPSLPGVQAACLLRREVQQSGAGIFVGEDGYIQGDIGFSRN